MRMIYCLVFVVWGGLLYAQGSEELFAQALQEHGIEMIDSAPIMQDAELRESFLHMVSRLAGNPDGLRAFVEAYAPLLDGQLRRSPLTGAETFGERDDLSPEQRLEAEGFYEQSIRVMSTRSTYAPHIPTYKKDAPVLGYFLVGVLGVTVVSGIIMAVWQRHKDRKRLRRVDRSHDLHDLGLNPRDGASQL